MANPVVITLLNIRLPQLRHLGSSHGPNLGSACLTHPDPLTVGTGGCGPRMVGHGRVWASGGNGCAWRRDPPYVILEMTHLLSTEPR